jgi:hypothetical protein
MEGANIMFIFLFSSLGDSLLFLIITMPPIRRPRRARAARYNPIIINRINRPGESLGRKYSSVLRAKSGLANSVIGFLVMAGLQTILAGCAAFTVWPHWRSRDEEKPKDSQ